MYRPKFSKLLALLALCGATSVQAQSLVAEHDFTGRCSILPTITLGTFDDASLDGWKGVNATKVECGTATRSQGPGYALVTTEKLPANQWRGISRQYDKPLDLSSCTMVEFSVLAPSERPGRYVWAQLTLTGSNGKKWQGRTEVIPSQWRHVLIDISSCEWRDKVSNVEVALSVESDSEWAESKVLFDNVRAGGVLDLNFSATGADKPFKSKGGKLSLANDALHFEWNGADARVWTDRLGESRNRIYNSPLDTFNTVHVVLDNHIATHRAELRVTADNSTELAPVQFEITPGKRSYYINLSKNGRVGGNLTGLSLAPVDAAQGSWDIDLIEMLAEPTIEPYAGKLVSCTANEKNLDIKLELNPKLLDEYYRLEIYEAPLHKVKDEYLTPIKLADLDMLYSGAAKPNMHITSIANSRHDGRMTRLSSRLLAVLRSTYGGVIKVAPFFFVENWRDFGPNPYAFELPDRQFSVLDYGAKGDGFTDDTDAFSKAIEACNKAGGGQVVVPGTPLYATDSLIGRRYILTSVNMASNVDLHLEKGAVLWQSADARQYKYDIKRGHDTDIPNVPWTHCIFVNRPIVAAVDLHNIKVTGKGLILLRNNYTRSTDTPWPHNECSDNLHVTPLGISFCHDVEVSDIEIRYPESYFTQFSSVKNMYIGNLLMTKPACTSGDGIGLSIGANHVRIVRCVYASNDDGVTLTTSYGDPRNTVSSWRPARDLPDLCVSNIEVLHSYINSGETGRVGNVGAHAIAFLPWGKTNPNPEAAQITDVEVNDCVLRGPWSVGVWPDTPFDGRPFANDQRDDYSSISRVHISGNEYLGMADLMWVLPTSFTGDSGIKSAGTIMNGDFTDGSCYWTKNGNVAFNRNSRIATLQDKGAQISQGLWLEPGTYEIEIESEGALEVKVNGLNATNFKQSWTVRDQKSRLTFTISEADDYDVVFVGKAKGVVLKNVATKKIK